MKTILLIEDNLEIRENTGEILELAGYNVLTAENGKIGVASAQEHLPDLIICDIMMPELDGYGVLHILGQQVKTAAIPFIYLTAKADKSDIRSGMNLGADDYITKPFEEIDLLQTIERRLKRIEKIRQIGTASTDEKLSLLFNQSKGIEGLKALSKEREEVQYQKKQLLFTEGGYPHKVFYLESGTVKTYRSNDLGKELITNVYKTGDFIGYHAVLENKAYQESAMALEDCTVSIIPKDDFFALLYNDRDVAHQFIKMLSNNLSDKEERLLNLAYNSVRRRLADALVELGNKSNSDEIQISREDLSNLVGTSKETVIRTLSDFKSEGLIETSSTKIKIINPKKLAFIIG